MSNLNKRNEKDDAKQREESASSHGIQSAPSTLQEVTPEQVAPPETSEEPDEHPIHSDDLEERAQALLDEAIKETFPASDPVSIPTFEEALETVKAQKAQEQAQQKKAREQAAARR